MSKKDELRRRREGLSAGQRELLASRLRGQRAGAEPEPDAIQPRPPGSPPVLSFPQQRIWFLDQLAGDASFNEAAALRLVGELDVGALERAFAAIVARHEVLRTGFDRIDGLPVPRVEAAVKLPLPIVDLSHLDEDDRLGEALRRAREDAAIPLDLAAPPPLRLLLLRLDSRTHVLSCTLHHIASDGWSAGVMVSELAARYAALRDRRPDPLAPLPIQYADFAHWQRNRSGSVLERQLARWRERLAGTVPAIQLTRDRSRPPDREGDPVVLRVAAGDAAALKALAAAHGATPFMILVAAFGVALQRHTGMVDLPLGTLVANRDRPELEPLIGCFINAVVLRLDLGGDPTGSELIGRVRALSLEAQAGAELPFEQLVEALRPERDAHRHPLFDFLVVGNNAPSGALALPGLSIEPLELPRSARYELECYLTVTDGGWEVHFLHQPSALPGRTVDELARGTATVLRQLARDPARRISDIPVLDEVARRRILVHWNRSELPVQHATSFPALFEEQARRTPEATAVVFGSRSCTYAELDRLSSRMGRALRAAVTASGPEPVIGVLAPRSDRFVAALVGILKAAAVYLPLDPRHPAERLAQVLEQAHPALLVVDGGSRSELEAALARLPAAGRPALLDLAALAAASIGDERLDRAPRPEQLAYLLFTSGSTGVPKGAMIEHRGMLNHLHAKVAALGIGPGDRVVQNASQCFDISVWQMLVALLVGGTTHVVDDETALDPRRLWSEVRDGGATLLEVVPSLLAVLLEQLPPDEEAPPALRWLIPTGEALPVQAARQWLERFPSIPMMNAYGPTECSDDVTHHVLDRPPPSDQATVPIGSPVANMRMYVLDGRLEPLPAGATGELWVGGIGVGRGYLGDPARTAEVFVPDPFGPSPGTRLYRTGDRGRWRHDGALEFLGRGDGQIKLRGFRIELGEIESALGRHPGVREAVVVAHAGGGDAQLIAHCVARSGATLTAADIQAWLRRSLPEYMVPALVSFLPALPLTPNGKVDRRALPVPRAEPPARDDLDEPATDTERRLASLWCALLDRQWVGRRHNFFDLGGHSLLAVRLQGRIEAELGARPPLHDILVARDLAALAAAVEAARSLPGPRLAAGIDLHRDALLDESVAPAAPAPAALDGLALLTGATGFVGAFALAELMERTGLAALCLVRADSADEALRRLRENLSRYGLWQERWAARVHALAGDLARPRLGLSDRQWQRAAAETAVIFHAGALVNYAYDYPALAPSNVAGTRALLELACARRTKPVHHVSTIDVLGAPAEQVTFLEDAPPGRPEVLDTGYAQSKWVAEQLALAARARGLPVTIYRPGSVSGSSATGAANPDDANTRVLLASLALGVLPEMDTLIDLTPVDYVSRALVTLALDPAAAGGVFHLVNPRPVPWSTIVGLVRAVGYAPRLLPWPEWRARMMEIDRVRPLFEGAEVFHAMPRYDCRNTVARLEGTGVACPAIDERLIRTYVDALVSAGQLAPAR